MASWYERAIIYELLPEIFRDGNGDGFGDFDGLTQTLDYLANLGVTCIWLLPFYESPRKDDGYDIADFYRVDPRFGSPGDFVRFLEEAEARGLRVILDITFNHTSDRHPWFQDARKSEDSPYRDYYLWADEPVEVPGDENVVGVGRVWSWDETAGKYYHHTFYPHQPDLNPTDPRLQEEMKKILAYWLRLGVSGFRIDVVSRMLRPKPGVEFDGDPHRLLTELREFVASQRHDAILLGEVDVDPGEYTHYFGDGDRLQAILNFYLAGFTFLALAEGDGTPIRRAFEALARPPRGAHYANFLRNHDELDLEQLSDEERRRVLCAFAPEPEMQIYGRGARRRLATMLDGDEHRIRLAYSLLLTLPGIPVLFYGDEIGMGEDLSLEGRNAVRTPMQWSDHENAGFSAAAPERLVEPVVSGGAYGFERRNVAAQRRDPESLLTWVTRAIRARRECPEFGLGASRFLDTGDARVLAHVSENGGTSAVALHNLSADEVEVTLAELETERIEVLADRSYEPPDGGRARLGPHGFRWFRRNEFHA